MVPGGFAAVEQSLRPVTDPHRPVGGPVGPAGPRLAHGYPFTAPAEAFMIRFWKMKKITATGIVMSSAAASFSGY